MATSITTTSDWNNIANDLTADYILESDLDFGGANIVGLGVASETYFTGNLDGNGHILKNFVLDYDNANGLFFGIEAGSTVEKLGIENATINGTFAVGAICHRNHGLISNCYVKNTDIYTASTANYVGMFAGRNIEGTVEYCFGQVTCTGNEDTTGIVGQMFGATMTESFYDLDNSDVDTSTYNNGTPLTETEAKTAQTYIDAGWDTSIWNLQDGSYPKFGATEPPTQNESDGIHLPIGISINSQTVLEYHSDGVQVDLGVDVNSQVILERHSNGIDVGLQIDINSQEVTESYSNGSNIDLNIEVSSQQLETFSRGSSIDLEINIEGDGRQTLDLIQETILLADLDRGITLKGDRNVNINLIGTKDSETNLNAEF